MQLKDMDMLNIRYTAAEGKRYMVCYGEQIIKSGFQNEEKAQNFLIEWLAGILKSGCTFNPYRVGHC